MSEQKEPTCTTCGEVYEDCRCKDCPCDLCEEVRRALAREMRWQELTRQIAALEEERRNLYE